MIKIKLEGEKLMYQYTFNDGAVYTSNLEMKEFMKRLRRLDTLRVLTEGYDEGVGLDICRKALRAYEKRNNFTGVIHLTFSEKDFLSYIYSDDRMLTDRDKETLEWYLKH